MQKTAPPSMKLEGVIPVSDLEYHAQGWLLDGEIRQWSPRTLDSRRRLIDKLLWFVRHRNFMQCGLPEIRAFLAYVTRGHEERGGRWGNPQMVRQVRPSTVSSYYNILRAFFAFLVEEGAIAESPIARLRPPVTRADQVEPFTSDQIAALMNAARASAHPRRNEAILMFLLDTGCRASELCSLRLQDLDLSGRRATVRGKGNKSRTIFLGRHATKVLWGYLREEAREPGEPLFLADRGTRTGEPLTRSGLGQLIRRLGRAARLETARCGPHRFRHTFAIEFLRAGGNVFTLKELLGHVTLAMTNRYVALAQADLASQHQRFSPGDRLR